MESSQEKRCLVVGCGYVGRPLAATLMGKGWDVGGVVRSEASRQQLEQSGIQGIQGDVADAKFWERLPTEWSHVVYCPSTGGGGLEAYRQIHGTGLDHAFQWLPDDAKLFYTSSTSVYGQDDGQVVDETSVTDPSSESAGELVKAEHRVCAAGHTVLRLGGIYGPERGVLLKRLREGKAVIPEQDPKWLNLIYLSDIIGAIQHGLAGQLEAGQVYNVIDNEPASYRGIYEWLCERLELPLPPTGTPEYFGKRGISNKRVSNAKLRAAGWEPEHSSFREGYTEFLKKKSV